MKKNIGFLPVFVLLSIILLTACNTAKEPVNEPANDSTTADSDIKDNIETNEPEITKDVEDNTNNNGTVNFISNGEEKSVQTTPITGDNYTIQTIPSFELTAEEPGRDVLYLKEDDSVYMRIEAMDVNSTTFENLVTNTKETMTAINEQVEDFDIEKYTTNEDFTKKAGFVTNYEDEKITMIVTEKENQLVRLSIYDTPQYDLSEAMLKMGLTVELN